MKLMEVSGRNLVRYIDFIGNVLDVKPLYKFEETPVINVDRAGYSPEVAAILGNENYMQNHIVILNERQKDCDILNQGFSFKKEIVEEAYSKCKEVIEEITEQELIYGKINLNFNNDVQEVVNLTDIINKHLKGNSIYIRSNKIEEIQEKGLKVYVELNTTMGSIKRISKSIKHLEGLTDDNKLCLDNNELNKIKMIYSNIFERYGNIRRFKNYQKSISIDNVKVAKFHNSKEDIYVIHNENTGTLDILTFGTEIDADIPKKLEKVNISSQKNLSNILDVLVKNGFMAFNKQEGEQRMEEIENNILIKYGHKLIRETNKKNDSNKKAKGEELINKTIGRMERYRIFQKHASLIEELGNHWGLLKQTIYEDKSISYLPLDLRLAFIGDSTEDPLIKEIISKINPTNFIYTQKNDPTSFKDFFKDADEDTQKMILTRLERTTEEDLNPKVLGWLNKEYHTLLSNKLRDLNRDMENKKKTEVQDNKLENKEKKQ